MTESRDDTLRSGYLSEESKKRFTLLAGVLGGVFFLLQFLVPMAAMFAIMPAMMTGWSVETFEVSNAAMYRGEVHLVQSTMSVGDAGAQSSPNRLVRLGPEGVEEVAPLEGWAPRLLADGERLWLIASDRMAVLEGGRIEPVAVPEPLGDICNPFLLGGAPAVAERRPDGVRLLRWEDGGWKEREPLHGVRNVCSLQGLETDEGLLLLRKDGESLYSTRPTADALRWTVALSDPGEWRLLELDGRPAVVSLTRRGLFRIVRFEGQRWTSAANAQGAGGAAMGDIAAFQEGAGAPLTVVTEGFTGSLRVRTWDGARLVDERRLGRSSVFPSGMVLLMTMPHLGTVLLSLVLAFILAGMMRTHRVGVYRHEGREVSYASLTRRAIAQVADAAVFGLPAFLLFWQAFSDLDQLVESGPLFPFRFFARMAAAIAWGFLALVGFAVTEGLWGWTPGKLLTGYASSAPTCDPAASVGPSSAISSSSWTASSTS